MPLTGPASTSAAQAGVFEGQEPSLDDHDAFYASHNLHGVTDVSTTPKKQQNLLRVSATGSGHVEISDIVLSYHAT